MGKDSHSSAEAIENMQGSADDLPRIFLPLFVLKIECIFQSRFSVLRVDYPTYVYYTGLANSVCTREKYKG